MSQSLDYDKFIQVASVLSDSYRLILDRRDKLGYLMYTYIEKKKPSSIEKFKFNIHRSNLKVEDIVNTIIGCFEHQKQFLPILYKLGRLHRGYHINKNDYNMLRDAFIYASKSALKDQFTPAMEYAWRSAYDYISDILLKARVGNKKNFLDMQCFN